MKTLGYTFKNSALLQQALTHRSVGLSNNERLEFLGDSILNIIISQQLFHQFEYATEGELTRLRSQLVNGTSLAKIALDLKVDDFLYLGMGEKASGGHRRESILADTVEAIIAAIYLDSHMDMKIVQKCVLAWYASRLDKLSLKELVKDPKTILQEWLQAHKYALPAYTLTKTEGKAHEQIFHIQCDVNALSISVEGVALSRRIAEQIAAQKILALLEDKHE
jgi:ribonuclease-3